MMDRLRPRLSQSYSWMEVAKETMRNVLEGQDKKKKKEIILSITVYKLYVPLFPLL